LKRHPLLPNEDDDVHVARASVDRQWVQLIYFIATVAERLHLTLRAEQQPG